MAAEFGLDPAIAMELMQCIETLVKSPEDLAEIKEISFYRKYNRMRDGHLTIGDAAPVLHEPLVSFNRRDSASPSANPRDMFSIAQLDLNEFMHDHLDTPTIIIASSCS